MGIKVNGQAGPRVVSDGSETEVRLGRVSCVITSDAHGRYAEASVRSQLFSAGTLSAGVAPGTALSAAPPMALWNPPGSGVTLSVLRAALGYVSGTLGAGTVVWGNTPAQVTTPTGGAELTTQSLSLSAARARGRAWQGSTLVAAPTMMFPAFTIQPTLATAPAAGGPTPAAAAVDDVAGLISVPPGAVLALQGVAAAGTTPLVLIGLVWEELPYVM